MEGRLMVVIEDVIFLLMLSSLMWPLSLLFSGDGGGGAHGSSGEIVFL